MSRKKPAKKPPSVGKAEQTIDLKLDKSLLNRCTELAKKKRISIDALVARGIRVVLAAEGE